MTEHLRFVIFETNYCLVKSRGSSGRQDTCCQLHTDAVTLSETTHDCSDCNNVLSLGQEAHRCASHSRLLMPCWAYRLASMLSVLMQAGLPKQLRTIVDLEALLNDGTAYTLFVILRGYAEGENPAAADTVKYAASTIFA